MGCEDFLSLEDECRACEYGFLDFIGCLIEDIKLLECKIVRLRYLLGECHPDKFTGEALKQEILSDSLCCYSDIPEYLKFCAERHNSLDPIESKSFCTLLWNLAQGNHVPMVDI